MPGSFQSGPGLGDCHSDLGPTLDMSHVLGKGPQRGPGLEQIEPLKRKEGDVEQQNRVGGKLFKVGRGEGVREKLRK